MLGAGLGHIVKNHSVFFFFFFFLQYLSFQQVKE